MCKVSGIGSGLSVIGGKNEVGQQGQQQQQQQSVGGGGGALTVQQQQNALANSYKMAGIPTFHPQQAPMFLNVAFLNGNGGNFLNASNINSNSKKRSFDAAMESSSSSSRVLEEKKVQPSSKRKRRNLCICEQIACKVGGESCRQLEERLGSDHWLAGSMLQLPPKGSLRCGVNVRERWLEHLGITEEQVEEKKLARPEIRWVHFADHLFNYDATIDQQQPLKRRRLRYVVEPQDVNVTSDFIKKGKHTGKVVPVPSSERFDMFQRQLHGSPKEPLSDKECASSVGSSSGASSNGSSSRTDLSAGSMIVPPFSSTPAASFLPNAMVNNPTLQNQQGMKQILLHQQQQQQQQQQYYVAMPQLHLQGQPQLAVRQDGNIPQLLWSIPPSAKMGNDGAVNGLPVAAMVPAQSSSSPLSLPSTSLPWSKNMNLPTQQQQQQQQYFMPSLLPQVQQPHQMVSLSPKQIFNPSDGIQQTLNNVQKEIERARQSSTERILQVQKQMH